MVGYVAHARRQLPCSHIHLLAGDALALPFRDGTFDASLALLVLHGVPDARKAAAEMCRVTRPGGRVAACEGNFRGGMDLLRLLSDALVHVEPEAEPQHARYTHLGGEGELRALLRECGLTGIEETYVSIPLEFASFDDFWEPILAGSTPRTARIAGLPPAKKAAVREWVRQQLQSERAYGPFTLRAGNAGSWRGAPAATRKLVVGLQACLLTAVERHQ